MAAYVTPVHVGLSWKKSRPRNNLTESTAERQRIRGKAAQLMRTNEHHEFSTVVEKPHSSR